MPRGNELVLTMESLIPYLCSIVSYRVVSTCLLSVPCTHIGGMYIRRPKGATPWSSLLFPFTGGNRHIVLQLMSWILWAFSLLMFLPVMLAMLPGSYHLSKDLPNIPHSHVDVVSGAAACVSFIGELFMIKAILVYDDSRAAVSTDSRGLKPRPVVASAVVVVLGLLLSFTGFMLLMALEYMPDIPSKVLYCCLSLSCFLIAASTTYGLGGFLRYGSNGSMGKDDGMWNFFQPFAGGTAFVTTQAISWSMFAATVVLLVVLIQQLVAGVAQCFRCWAIGTGMLMVLVQAMLGLSLLLFRSPKSTAVKLMRAASGALTSSITEKQGWLGANMPIILMYSPVHVFFALWALSFVFLPPNVAVAVWVAFLVPYYGITHQGNPAHTGCRQWRWLMAWFADNIEGSLRHWFGSLTVVYDGDPVCAAAYIADAQTSDKTLAPTAPEATSVNLMAAEQGEDCPIAAQVSPTVDSADSNSTDNAAPYHPTSASTAALQQLDEDANERIPDRYMFGFQPHGLYPTGAGFLPWMPSFKQHFPDVNPVTLTATVIFFPPFIRDICCWAGFRQVSKRTFLDTLREKGAVMFCPGGQAELVHAWKSFLPVHTRELVLHTRHKGFCRIAIEQQAALVPVLALGEALQLKNAINLPRLQQYTYRRLGFPVPFVLQGRWGITPFPRKVPLVYVIGKPLSPPSHVPGQHVTAEAVDVLHKQYYDSLADLYQRYKHFHPEFKDAKLVLTDE